MDNQRILLWAALGFLLLQLWTSWQIDYGPKPVAPAPSATSEVANPVAIDQFGTNHTSPSRSPHQNSQSPFEL